MKASGKEVVLAAKNNSTQLLFSENLHFVKFWVEKVFNFKQFALIKKKMILEKFHEEKILC